MSNPLSLDEIFERYVEICGTFDPPLISRAFKRLPEKQQDRLWAFVEERKSLSQIAKEGRASLTSCKSSIQDGIYCLAWAVRLEKRIEEEGESMPISALALSQKARRCLTALNVDNLGQIDRRELDLCVKVGAIDLRSANDITQALDSL